MNERLVHLVERYAKILHPKLIPRSNIDELRFECFAGCLECCKGGHILVVPEKDLQERLAENLYLMPITGLKVMRRVSGACPYLESGLCSIQDYKPLACRGYPIFLDPFTQEVYVDIKCLGVGSGGILSLEGEAKMIQARRDYWDAMNLSEEEKKLVSDMLIIPNITQKAK